MCHGPRRDCPSCRSIVLRVSLPFREHSLESSCCTVPLRFTPAPASIPRCWCDGCPTRRGPTPGICACRRASQQGVQDGESHNHIATCLLKRKLAFAFVVIIILQFQTDHLTQYGKAAGMVLAFASELRRQMVLHAACNGHRNRRQQEPTPNLNGTDAQFLTSPRS